MNLTGRFCIQAFDIRGRLSTFITTKLHLNAQQLLFVVIHDICAELGVPPKDLVRIRHDSVMINRAAACGWLHKHLFSTAENQLCIALILHTEQCGIKNSVRWAAKVHDSVARAGEESSSSSPG